MLTEDQIRRAVKEALVNLEEISQMDDLEIYVHPADHEEYVRNAVQRITSVRPVWMVGVVTVQGLTLVADDRVPRGSVVVRRVILDPNETSIDRLSHGN